MDNLTCREYRSEDVEDLLSIRNAIFPPLTVEQWRQCEPAMTASLAYLGDEVVGAIPLDQRDFLAAPGAVIATAFENAVGTREDMRSRGVGGKMIDAAKEFLAGRTDMLMVYRGGERSDGYRFYVKSGHRDLLYLRQGVWQPESETAGAAVLGPDDLYAEQASVYEVFMATFGGFGGFPPRHPEFWRPALSAMIYEVLPQETVYVRYPAQGELQAYLIAGKPSGARARDTWMIEEAASATGPAAMHACFATLGRLAAQQECEVTMFLSREHPWLELCRALGFQEGARQMMIMGQLVSPQALFPKTCVDEELVSDLRVKVWTPTVDYVLHEPERVRREVTLETKDEYLIRLLCRRLDLQSAVETDLVTLQGGDEVTLKRLAAAFPYAPWAYLHLDYL